MTMAQHEVLLASNSSRFSDVFKREMSSRHFVLETANAPRKLTMFCKRKIGPDVTILDLDSMNKNLSAFIFYLRKFRKEMPTVVVSETSDFSILDKVNKNLHVLLFMPRPDSKRKINDLLNNIQDFLSEDLKKKMTRVEYLKEENVFACTFADKGLYFIKRDSIPGDDSARRVKSCEIGPDQYYFLIRYDNDEVIDVAWDFVRSPEGESEMFRPVKTIEGRSQLTAGEIGQKIVEWRDKRNMTQEQLTLKTGILRNNISRIENGHHHPSLPVLEKIAVALDIPVVDLLT